MIRYLLTYYILIIFSMPSQSSLSSSLEKQLTVDCNAGCNCMRELYNPVCGADGVMYYSPCHAGCSSINHTSHPTGKQVQHTHTFLMFTFSYHMEMTTISYSKRLCS